MEETLDKMKNFATYSETFSSLDALARGYMASRIFLTALELSVFEQLGTRQLTAAQIAQELKADAKAMEVLLNALAGMRLLKKQDNMFTNCKESEDLLIPSSPNYRGGAFHHIANLWASWSHLTETVKSGQTLNRRWTNKMKLDLSLIMQEQAKVRADKLARVIDCSNAARMLDIGGGPGAYAVAFARCCPNLKIDCFDRDNQALKLAGEEIARHGLADRVSLKKGDFFTDEIGSDYDLVLLSSIVCLFGEDENILLFSKVKKALKDGGRAVVWDVLLDEQKTQPSFAAIFAVNMLVNTRHGRLYNISEIKDLLGRAGFKDIFIIPVSSSTAIVGRV